jgi:hypothetical protein
MLSFQNPEREKNKVGDEESGRRKRKLEKNVFGQLNQFIPF